MSKRDRTSLSCQVVAKGAGGASSSPSAKEAKRTKKSDEAMMSGDDMDDSSDELTNWTLSFYANPSTDAPPEEKCAIFIAPNATLAELRQEIEDVCDDMAADDFVFLTQKKTRISRKQENELPLKHTIGVAPASSTPNPALLSGSGPGGASQQSALETKAFELFEGTLNAMASMPLTPFTKVENVVDLLRSQRPHCPQVVTTTGIECAIAWLRDALGRTSVVKQLLCLLHGATTSAIQLAATGSTEFTAASQQDSESHAMQLSCAIDDWTSSCSAPARRTWMPHTRSFGTPADFASQARHASELTPLERRAAAFHRVSWAVQTTVAGFELLGSMFEAANASAYRSVDAASTPPPPLHDAGAAIRLADLVLYESLFAIPTADAPLVRHLAPGAAAAAAARRACLAMLRCCDGNEGLVLLHNRLNLLHRDLYDKSRQSESEAETWNALVVDEPKEGTATITIADNIDDDAQMTSVAHDAEIIDCTVPVKPHCPPVSALFQLQKLPADISDMTVSPGIRAWIPPAANAPSPSSVREPVHFGRMRERSDGGAGTC
ncbi:UBA domain-containing protein [Pseudoscourfieldia marina]